MNGFVSGELDLLAVSILVATFGLLGFVVFSSNPKSVTARAFLYFSLATILFVVVNYSIFQVSSLKWALWAYRILLFSAVLNALSLFNFLYVFPANKPILSRWYKAIIVPFSLFTALLCLTPFMFVAIGGEIRKGFLIDPERGWGIILFVLTILFLVFGSIFLFAKKTLRSEGLERKKFVYILTGTVLSITMVTVFNFALPTFFGILKFIPFAPVFFLPFVFFAAFAIAKFRVLSVDASDTRAFLTLFVILAFSGIFALILLFSRNFGL